MIPEALGGDLVSRFLCKQCNSFLGHQFEGLAKTDPSVRTIVEQLAPSIPHLAKRLSEGQAYVSSGPGGKSRGFIKNGEFMVQSRISEDGSLIQPTKDATKTLNKLLAREGHGKAEVEEALRRFNDAPENIAINLSPTLEVVKWQVNRLQPMLDGPLLNSVVPVKSAFEFIALHVGTAIYGDSPALAAIRNMLSQGRVDSDQVEVERLHAPEAKPFHGLVFEGNDPYAKVQLRLFGKLAFRVHLKRLSVSGPRVMYTHDLEINKEYLKELPE